jgi:serine/threonine protein kinase
MSSLSLIQDSTAVQWDRIDLHTYERTKTKNGRTSLLTYTVQNRLGYGVTGEVYRLGCSDLNKRSKALKICNPIDPLLSEEVPCPSLSDPNKLGCVIEEENAGLKLLPKSPGLPSCKAYFPHEVEKKLPASLILHLYDFTFYDSSKVDTLTLGQLLMSLEQIATGLITLHTGLKIIHGDLEHINVMFDERKQRADMIDFGLAQKLEDPEEEEAFNNACHGEVIRLTEWLKPIFQKRLNSLPQQLQSLIDEALEQTTATDLVALIKKAIALHDSQI